MILVYGVSIIYLLLMVILLILSLFVNIKVSTKQSYLLSALSALSLGVIAYGTFPNEGTDLSRYYVELDIMRQFGLDYVYNSSLYKDTFIINMIFYLISLTNNNNLLPFISTVIIFLFFFHVIIQEQKKFNINSTVVSLFILSFIAVIFLRPLLTGVRQHLALTILLFAFYRELIQNKKNISTLLIYIIPTLIHVQTVPILIVRLLFLFKGKIYKLRYLLPFWSLLIPVFSFVSQKNNYLSYSYEKLLGYQENEYPDIRLYITVIVFFGLLFFLASTVSKEKAILCSLNLEKYMKFYNLLLLFTVGCFPIPHLFARMIGFSTYMSLPILFVFFQVLNRRYKSMISFLFLFIIVGLLAYQMVDAHVSWRLVFN